MNKANEPILLHFDENGYQHKKHLIENEILLKVQSVIDAYNNLQFAEKEGSKKRPLLPEDFERLFNEPVDLIFDKMTGGEAVSIAGLQVHKSKAIDILHKPSGYNTLLETVDKTVSYLKSTGHNISISVSEITNWFELKENTVIINPERLAEIAEYYKKYAKTDRAKKMYAFANFILDKAKELGIESEIKHNPNGFGNVVNHLFNQPHYGALQTVNTDTISKYNSAEFTP